MVNSTTIHQSHQMTTISFTELANQFNLAATAITKYDTLFAELDVIVKRMAKTTNELVDSKKQVFDLTKENTNLLKQIDDLKAKNRKLVAALTDDAVREQVMLPVKVTEAEKPKTDSRITEAKCGNHYHAWLSAEYPNGRINESPNVKTGTVFKNGDETFTVLGISSLPKFKGFLWGFSNDNKTATHWGTWSTTNDFINNGWTIHE